MDSTSPSRPLVPGATAPPFSLAATPQKKLSLKDYAGSPLVLVFYPADFSPVCSDELAVFNELLPEFRGYGAHLMGISVDGTYSHMAFAREKRLHFPLLSDFHPKGEVSKKYGAYRENDGVAERAIFVIGLDGKIFWSQLSPMNVNPGADGALEAVEQLSVHSAPELSP